MSGLCAAVACPLALHKGFDGLTGRLQSTHSGPAQGTNQVSDTGRKQIFCFSKRVGTKVAIAKLQTIAWRQL